MYAAQGSQLPRDIAHQSVTVDDLVVLLAISERRREQRAIGCDVARLERAARLCVAGFQLCCDGVGH